MAKLGDALTALVRQVRFDKLDPLLNHTTGTSKATPLTHAPVAPVGAKQADAGVTADVTRAGVRPPATAAPQSTTTAVPQAPVSAQTRLSNDAALIAALLGNAPASTARTPLPVAALDVSAEAPEHVARALVRSVATSGLFYESHLHEWVEGRRPLESLHAEPQQRLAALPLRATAMPADSVEAGTAPSSTPTTLNAANTGSTAAAAPLPESLAALVREQLDTLDFRRVHWQGEVWPQQQAELEITEEDTRREAEDEAPRTWATTLRLDLPHLGAVEARVLLDGDNFQISVRADAQALPALESGRAAFADALDEAGIRLRHVEVRPHE